MYRVSGAFPSGSQNLGWRLRPGDRLCGLRTIPCAGKLTEIGRIAHEFWNWRSSRILMAGGERRPLVEPRREAWCLIGWGAGWRLELAVELASVYGRAMKGAAMARGRGGEVAVLRIELSGVEPLIWRRVAVSTSMTLTQVHLVIQAAMGWLDCHLWHFEAGGCRYSMRVASVPEWNERYEDAARVTLGALLESGLRRFDYAYDMGDNWEHSVIAEKVGAPAPGVKYPQFLAGRGAVRPRIAAACPAILSS